MDSPPKITKELLEKSVMDSFESMGKVVGVQKLRSIFLGAKASLLGDSSLPKTTRLQQLLIHRNVEKKLFGEIQSLPGEEELLKENQSQMQFSEEKQGLPQRNAEVSAATPRKDLLEHALPQTLADELSKRKVDSVALTIAGAILAVAIVSAANIEQSFWKECGSLDKFKDDDFQDIVTEFVYVFLHLCDRDAFEAIPDPQKRGRFLDSVFDLVRLLGTTLPMTDGHSIPTFTRREEKIPPGILIVTHGMPLLNERQAEYSLLKLFAAKDEPQLTGTLFWEFGNHVTEISSRYKDNAYIQFEAKLLASAAYTELIPIFGKMREAPSKPVGFFRRLLKW